MGLVQTPGGETIYVPDGLFGGGQLGAPALGVNPELALPPMSGPGPGPGATLPPAALTPAPLPSANPELPIAQPQQPAPNLQTSPIDTINAAPQLKPDFEINPTNGQPAPPPAAPKAGKPPGKPSGPQLPSDIQQSEQGQVQALADREQAARDLGESQKQAAIEQAATLEERNKNIATLQAQQAEAEKQRQAGIATKQKEYDDSVNAFATKKIDDQRRWNNTGTGQKVLAGISVALSTIGQALMGKGGTNPALDIITGAIKDDVAAQVRDRENMKEVAGAKRTSLDDYLSRTKSAREAESLKVAEEYKRTADQIETIAARHQGTDIAAHAADLSAQLRGQAAQIVGQAGQQAFERTTKQKELANQTAQVGIAGGHLALARKQEAFDENFRTKQLENEDKKLAIEAAKLEQLGKTKDAKEVLAQGVAAPPQTVVDKDGNVTVNNDTGYAKQKDGTPWIVPTPDEAKAFRAKKTSAESIIDIVDEIRGIRDRVGGESEWGNSDDFQRLQVLKQNLVLLRKAGTQGMSSDADMERIEKALGASNPASFRAQSAGLEAGRTQIIKQLNTEARNLNYSGDDFKYPDPLKAATPAKSADDTKLGLALKNPVRDVDINQSLGEFGVEPSARSYQGSGPAGALNVKLAGNQGLLPSVKTTLDNWGQMLKSPDPALRQRASAFLQQVASTAETDAAKSYAFNLLKPTSVVDAR